MSWWWSGAIGAARKRREDNPVETSGVADKFQNVALVIGATGIVGTSLVDILPLADTPGGPWKVYAVSRRSPAAFLPPVSPAVVHIQCDVSDAGDVSAKLSPLTDVTHIFYTAWVSRATESENRTANCVMLRNVLSTVMSFAGGLRHVCLQTGRKHYLGPFESLHPSEVPDPPYHEDLPRLTTPNFYYDMEDALFDEIARASAAAVTWSVHRPSIIFGFSPISLMNIVGTLCVYAAICKKEGSKLRWPGNRVAWEGFSDASDADLIAEQEIWSSVEPLGQNQAFNCSNGDLFKWKHLWPLLGEQFGVETVGYGGEDGRFKLTEAMEGKEGLWKELVAEHRLAPIPFAEVGNWWYADIIFNVDAEHLDTMNKSKEHGFIGFRNSTKSFLHWIGKMKTCNIVP